VIEFRAASRTSRDREVVLTMEPLEPLEPLGQYRSCVYDFTLEVIGVLYSPRALAATLRILVMRKGLVR